jgi:hypothetical protein
MPATPSLELQILTGHMVTVDAVNSEVDTVGDWKKKAATVI